MTGVRIDYHTHTARCRHATGTMREYLEAACARGIAELAFTDHIPMTHPVLAPFCMAEGELDGYVAEVLELRDEFAGRIRVKLGIEADFVAGEERHVAALLAAHPFDVVLGSVHVMDDWGIDNDRYLEYYRAGNIEEIFSRYFEHLAMAARTGLFDIISHPDVVKKFNYLPARADYSDLFAGAVDAIAASGMAIEINASGFRRPVGEQYPGRAFLRRCLDRGVPLVTGSDSHAPAEVGADFDRVYALLAEEGVTSLATFTRRRRGVIPLAG
jgi:histidinol-phosphatase (PHP family)